MTDQTCTICGRPVDRPYRYSNPDGSYREGCVATVHDPYADAWQRQQAKAWKQAGRKRFAGGAR